MALVWRVMKAIMKIIAWTYRINEEYLNKLEMPLRLVCVFFFARMGATTQAHRFWGPFIEYIDYMLRIWRAYAAFSMHQTINCGSINITKDRNKMEWIKNKRTKRASGDTNVKFHHSSSCIFLLCCHRHRHRCCCCFLVWYWFVRFWYWYYGCCADLAV